MSIPAKALGLGMIFVAALAAPASAATEPKTRLVSCGAGDCLLVTGHRASAASIVAINGHAVPARGARAWRASLPLDTVRAWSAPYARTIAVSIDHGGSRKVTSEADLPIGLLGHAETLAMLIVSAK